MFKNWIILKDASGVHSYLYGDLDSLDSEDLEGLTLVSENEITAKDLVVLFGNELEDRNRHSMTDLGDIYLNSLKDLNLSQEQELKAIKKFIELFQISHM